MDTLPVPVIPRPAKHQVGLLVSVRNASEARIAIDHDIDILDVKEPNRGSLGRPDVRTVDQILQCIDDQCVSVALGELIELSTVKTTRFFDGVGMNRKIRFAKIGLSKMKGVVDWCQIWEQAIACLPEHVSPVATAYVDHDKAESPEIEQVFGTGRLLGCRMALLDTFDKSAGRFLEHDSIEKFIWYRQLANTLQMGFVLAGSVGITTLAAVQEIEPQFVGIRGAICYDEDRESKVDANALSYFSKSLRSVKASH